MKNKDRNTLGRRIANQRRVRQLTQQQLADSVGINRSYLAQIESDRKRPSLGTLTKLADCLVVSVGTLVEDDAVLAELRAIVDREGLDSLLASVSRLLAHGSR